MPTCLDHTPRRRTLARAVALGCLLLAAIPTGAFAQVAKPTPDLDTLFGSIAPTSPGCAAGLAVAGAPPLIRTYGLADLEHPEPITARTVFESGSLAKQFTAAAMLLLVQDGKLTLDDDIRRYLPEMPDFGTPITIRHLLNHTSGLREQWSLLALAGDPPGTQVHGQGTILDLSSRQKGLNFAPGTEFLYTNTNYVLAATIVERVSGQTLQAFTDQRLFRPLGMGQTRWREDFRTVVPGRATAYAPADTGFIASMPFTNVYGNGGLLTTIEDLLRWNAFLDKPSDLPGGPALVTALETPGRLKDGAPLAYALGLEVTTDHGRRLVSHSGSTGGYKSWAGRYPGQGVSVVVLCNNGGIDPVSLGEEVARQALPAAGRSKAASAVSAPRAVAAAQMATADLAPYQGLFRNPITGDLIQAEVANGQLILTQGARQALTSLGGDRFQRADGDGVRFTRTGQASTELTLSRGGTTQRFLAVRPAVDDAAALAAYVGTYYSTELDTRITVLQQGDALVMRQPFAVEWRLQPRFAGGFTTRLRGTTTFVFARAEDGRVSGFSAWANGARNIPFVRQ